MQNNRAIVIVALIAALLIFCVVLMKQPWQKKSVEIPQMTESTQVITESETVFMVEKNMEETEMTEADEDRKEETETETEDAVLQAATDSYSSDVWDPELIEEQQETSKQNISGKKPKKQKGEQRATEYYHNGEVTIIIPEGQSFGGG